MTAIDVDLSDFIGPTVTSTAPSYEATVTAELVCPSDLSVPAVGVTPKDACPALVKRRPVKGVMEDVAIFWRPGVPIADVDREAREWATRWHATYIPSRHVVPDGVGGFPLRGVHTDRAVTA